MARLLRGGPEQPLSYMATNRNSNTNKATTNTVKAMRRSAETRQCPGCNRKSALKFVSDEYQFGSACRWCGWESITIR